jgi:hypothetical protein
MFVGTLNNEKPVIAVKMAHHHHPSTNSDVDVPFLLHDDRLHHPGTLGIMMFVPVLH